MATPDTFVLLDPPVTADFAEEIAETLDRLARHVGGGATLDAVMDHVWEATTPLLPHDRASLAFVEDGGARVVTRWTRTAYGAPVLANGYSAPLAGSSLQNILDTGRARLIPDLAAHLAARPESASTRLLVEREGVRSSLTLPLQVEGRPVGFLFFSSRRDDRFTEEHARILFAALERIAQAVEKAWQIGRLGRALDGYRNAIGFVSHEMKGPLSAIVQRGRAYVEGLLGPVDASAAETVRALLRQAETALGMVDDSLDLAQVEGEAFRFAPRAGVPLKTECVLPVLTALEGPSLERRVRILDETTDLPVRGDPELLRLILRNLAGNAVKYAVDGGTVRLTCERVGGEVSLRIRNDGPGFSAEEAGRLFGRFVRLRQKGLEDRKGTGLGLYLAQLAAARHGGRILARSAQGHWAEFELRLPD